jgi:transposase
LGPQGATPLGDRTAPRGRLAFSSHLSKLGKPVWRAFALKPRQLESFKLSTGPLFIEKVRDIVGLYLNPPEAAIGLCIDEKTKVQALECLAAILPLLPRTPAKATHDYRRHGTTNLYAALDVASRCVISELTQRHRADEFRRFPNLVDRSNPAELDVHVIVDNSSTRKTPAIRRWLLCHPRFTFRFTRTYSSWLNLVQRWFAELTERLLRRGSQRSTKELVASIRTWIELWNEEPRPLVWHKSADEILQSFASYDCRITKS